MIKLIATDLDGTLFAKDNIKEIIEDENIKMLQKYHKNGGQIAIVSGRGTVYTSWVSKKLGFDCYDLSLNGAYNKLTDTAKTMPSETIINILTKLKTFDKPYTVLLSSSNGVLYALRNKYFCYAFSYLRSRNKKYVNRISKTKFSNKKIKEIINKNEVCKMLIYFKDKQDHNDFYSLLEKEKQKISLYFYKDYYEMNALGCNKGKAVQELIKELKIKNEEVLVVGDSDNDLSMIKKFENSATFTYAKKEIQKEAKYIIEKFKDIDNYLY